MLKSGTSLEVGDLVRQRSRTLYEYNGVRVPSLYYTEEDEIHKNSNNVGIILSKAFQERTNKKICTVLWISEINNITNEYETNLEIFNEDIRK